MVHAGTADAVVGLAEFCLQLLLLSLLQPPPKPPTPPPPRRPAVDGLAFTSCYFSEGGCN